MQFISVSVGHLMAHSDPLIFIYMKANTLAHRVINVIVSMQYLMVPVQWQATVNDNRIGNGMPNAVIDGCR